MINIENYRSGLIHNLFAKEPLVWNGLRRAGFVGVVDTFDESEHSAPYAAWHAGKPFRLGRATDVVKEAKRSLRVQYDVPADGSAPFFVVRPERKDFSPYRFLTFWVCRDPGLEPVVVADGGKVFPLVEAARRPVAQEWTRRYFEIPGEAKSGRVAEVRFLLTNAAAGTCWLDDVILTHEIPTNEVDFVLDDFADIRSKWVPSSAYRLAVVPGGRRVPPGGFREDGRGGPLEGHLRGAVLHGLEPLPLGRSLGPRGFGDSPAAEGWRRPGLRCRHVHPGRERGMETRLLQYPGQSESFKLLGTAI